MYEAFYGLRERPFNLTPDPKYLFLSDKHREAFAHLLYGIKNGNGFVMISGEIGTGKTTITRNLMQQLDEDTDIAFIFNPSLAPVELLKKINTEFGVDAQSDNVLGLVDQLNVYLLEANAQGRNCVLVIDEAQNLTPPVLEQIRLLSNLETETQKLLQIVLIGQPELMEMLSLHELRQLNQRITARYHLNPLDEDETIQYIAYRIHVAGGRRKVQFSKAAVRQIFKLTGGTPRMINALCDRALLIGYTREVRTIEPDIIKQASQEIWGDPKLYKSAARKYKARQKVEKQAAKEARPPRQPIQWGRLLPNPTISLVVILLVAGGVFLWPDMQHFLLEWREQSLAWRNTPTESASVTPETEVEPGDATDTATQDTASPALEELPAAPDAGAENLQTETLAFLEALAAQGGEDDADETALAAFMPGEGTDNAEGFSHPFAAGLQPVLQYWDVEAQEAIPAGDNEDALAAFAETHGLVFDKLTPTLEQVLALKLPVLIRMEDANEEGAEASRWATLLGEEDGGVRLAVLDNEFVVPQSAFRQHYTREAWVFWKDPAPNAPILSLGRSGAAVANLKAKLHALGRLPESNSNNQYDPETARAVAALQAETGLTVDSIAGQQVRMVLDSWLRDADILPEAFGTGSRTVVAQPTPAPTPAPEPEPEVPAQPQEQEPVAPEPEESSEPVSTPEPEASPPEVTPMVAEAVTPEISLPDSPLQQPTAGTEIPDAYTSPLWPSPFSPEVEGEEEDFVFQGDRSPLPQLPSSVTSDTEPEAGAALVDVRELPEPTVEDGTPAEEVIDAAEAEPVTPEASEDAEVSDALLPPGPDADNDMAEVYDDVSDEVAEAVDLDQSEADETELEADVASDMGIAEVVHIGPLMQGE